MKRTFCDRCNKEIIDKPHVMSKYITDLITINRSRFSEEKVELCDRCLEEFKKLQLELAVKSNAFLEEKVVK